MKIFNILWVLILFQTTAVAQNPSEDFLGSWYTYGSNHRFSERISVTPYAELRFYEPSSNYNLLFLSLRGNYHINSKSTFGLGYAYLDIDTVFEFDDVPHVIEHRILEQYTYKHTFSKLNINHRARLELRFLEFSNRNELQNRFRYRLGLSYKLNNTFFLALTEEGFVNFQDQVFHENRFYVGIGAHLIKNVQISAGYLKQHIRKNNLNRIMVGLNFKTDHRKTKLKP
ncbi:MAG: DUF2490 domain-containing protein [Winogradskyella sp.]